MLKILDSRFDQHLSQAENLRSLFTALNDECFEVFLENDYFYTLDKRTCGGCYWTINNQKPCLCNALFEKNFDPPSHGARHTYDSTFNLLLLEYSVDNRNKEESALLLGRLIKASDKLIKPYAESILKDLLRKLEPPQGLGFWDSKYCSNNSYR